MRVALTRIGATVSQVLAHPGDYTERAPVVRTTGGLGSPALKAFQARLDALLPPVLELYPHAAIEQLRTPLLLEALTTPALTQVTDDSLSRLLLQAAHTSLTIPKELKPIVDRDPATGQLVVAGVEGVAGLVRLLKEAGARSVTSGTVREADVFREVFDDGARRFHFEPNHHVRDRGPIVAFFAFVVLAKDQWQAKSLSVGDVERLRLASPSPDHRCWRDYADRMGECCAIRAIAAQLPQGTLDPKRAGWTQPEPMHPSQPIGMAPADDPYGDPAGCTAERADFRVTQSTPLHPPHLELLPGRSKDFGGWGGQRVGRCPDGILRGVLRWLDQDPTRDDRYPRLRAAITHVLGVRKATGKPQTQHD